MITQLTVNNFAIVNQLAIEFATGMTAITGETGAGKSIAIDALGLCLGNRSDAASVRQGAERADVSAHFLLDDTPAALVWLKENHLDDQSECILRRVINHDGRSKAFINGSAVPVSQLRELGQKLIQIHGQHEHQLLLKPEYQQMLLNNYMGESAILAEMKQSYKLWKEAGSQFTQYEKQRAEQDAHLQLLQYQLKELNEFAPVEGEYELIDEEYKRLSNSEQLISLSRQSVMLLTDNDEYNVLNLLHTAKHSVQELIAIDNQLASIFSMLDEAAIQVAEASNELRYYSESMDIDPARVAYIEQRLSKQVNLARKHQISPEQLPIFHQQLLEEFLKIQQKDEEGEQLKVKIRQYHQQALLLAETLHKKRLDYAQTLSAHITKTIRELSMPHGQFSIDIDYAESYLSEDGADHVIFMVSTNPGQPLQPIAKVASGGELSRIALAVQVLTAQKMDTPALIFDEIDVGISGPTAAKVGNLLRELGRSTQVITVTHLPQVAGNAHQHFFVAKQTDGTETTTSMQLLDQQGRLEELARLLGGDKITENTLANAKELIIDN